MKKRVVYCFDCETEYKAYCCLCDVLRMLKIHFLSYQDTGNEPEDIDDVYYCVEVGDDIDVS